MAAKKKGSIATVLAFEKKLVPSDGFMSGCMWEEGRKADALKRDQEQWGKLTKEQRAELDFPTPLKLQPKSVRGTISNRLKKSDLLKLDAKLENANIQRVDSCALGEHQDTLKLSFTLKVLSGVQYPSACNHEEFRKTYTAAAEKYIAEEGFAALAKRYALNIANARFMWRNRMGVEQLEVVVKQSNTDQQWTFDALSIGVRDFDQTSGDIEALAQLMAEALSGKRDFVLLEIEAYAQVGKAQDVYPSEELVHDKDKKDKKGKKSKVLYAVNEVAAMHSQKLGNALRTIDTWYRKYPEAGAIAIEPYGAVTNLGIAYRKDQTNFFNLFDQFALGETLASKEEAHYVMAVLVRGGVFGESGKE